MDINQTYCGKQFTVYVNQTIMLYVLNLHSDECQYINKCMPIHFSIKLGKEKNVHVYVKTIYKHTYIWTFTYMYIHTYRHVSVCIYVKCVCIYVYFYICMYMHKHTFCKKEHGNINQNESNWSPHGIGRITVEKTEKGMWFFLMLYSLTLTPP